MMTWEQMNIHKAIPSTDINRISEYTTMIFSFLLGAVSGSAVSSPIAPSSMKLCVS